MAAITITEFVSRARVLLQDTIPNPYRYSDDDMLDALNFGLHEIRRVRPDLFIYQSDVTEYTAVDATQLTAVDQQYHYPLLHFVVGYIQLRDEEGANEARASSFIQSFVNKLTLGYMT